MVIAIIFIIINLKNCVFEFGIITVLAFEKASLFLIKYQHSLALFVLFTFN